MIVLLKLSSIVTRFNEDLHLLIKHCKKSSSSASGNRQLLIIRFWGVAERHIKHFFVSGMALALTGSVPFNGGHINQLE